MNDHTELIINIIGYFGSALIIIAFTLNSLKLLKSFSVRYQILNLAGGALVLFNSWYYHAFPSVVISIFWVVISVVALTKIYRSRK